MPSEERRPGDAPSQWEQLEKKESALWRNGLALLVILAGALAVSSWDALRKAPLHLGAVPVGIVVLIALFAVYVWGKRREIAELRGFVRGMQQTASAPPTEKQFEQLLELVSRSQHGYRDLIDSLDHVVFTLSLSGEIQLVNRRFVEILGLAFDDVVHHPLDDFISEPLRADAELSLPRFLERRQWTGLVRARLKKNGEIRYFHCMLHAVVHEGRVIGISGLAADVTAQRESEARFTELFETIQEGVYLSTPDGTLLEVNPALVRMLGYSSREELLAVNAGDLYADPDERASFARDLELHGAVRDRQLTLLRKDGNPIHCLDSSVPMKDAAGRTVRFQGTLVDISARVEIERRLHQEQEFIRRLVDCFPDIIVVLDTQAKYTFVSPRIREVSGLEPEDLLGQPLGVRTHPEDRAALQKILEDLIGGKAVSGYAEYRTEQKDGSWRVFRANASPLFGADGKITGVVASARDVTDAKQLEQQLLQTEKLAAVGQMIAGVAHELNNPLTAILGVSDLLRERAADDQTRRQTELIHLQARRAADIVQSLLSFSRPPTTNRTPVQLDEIIRRAIQLHTHSLEKNHITVEFAPASALPPALADGNQLLQVFLNLLTNAEQAIHEVRDHGHIHIHFGHSPDKVWVSIEDDGPGVKPEARPRIFDPFFTTKRPGGGTGLGLTICLSIVREHRGTIELQASGGGGAVFRVVLPVAAKPGTPGLSAPAIDEAASVSSAPKAVRIPVTASPRRPGEGASILVIDDQEGIRELIQAGLSARGFSVESVASSQEAMALLAKRSFDAILCDMHLPDVSGEQLFERLRGCSDTSSHPFVFITGDLVDQQVIDSFAKRGARIVQKPFRISNLAALLTELIEPSSVNLAK